MVVEESEVGEVKSQLLVVGQLQKNHPLSALGRQSSIYSLTLDEFQHTLCEGGKNFGSMNMDEFLTSIWNAEENQATNSINNNHHNNGATGPVSSSHVNFSLNETAASSKGVVRQPSLPRQGSLTLPAPLCRKTVDEVWSEIHRVQQGQGQSNNSNLQNAENTSTRQPTIGQMTLEDFLIKAGVVREPCLPPPQHQQKFGLHQASNDPAVGTSFIPRPIMGIGGSDGFNGSTYQTMPPGGVLCDSSVYLNDGKRGGGYQSAAPPLSAAVCYNGKVATAGGYGPGQAMGMVSPISPVSPKGMCTNQVDIVATQFGMDIGGLRGRKRIIDGPIEKVVERRQRRMIKNRESAARSRARKQAYTVDLEAELNQLKQENAHLNQALAELERRQKQRCFEEWTMETQTKSRAKEKLRIIRRNLSCPL
ncbi:Basic-leucine zipper transcription factor family protein, putative isoform 4 [Hibiscus syriacus]|uniref:Basic-leucine zipper transcription factor family protein, putative isoform 4 n=1 Tax=Hibiscus syriacus TaxID=106335 RepID=A0A6A2ZFS9_HIBSY|nr:Basic-leucine zipper transcription factor family protein, putative isoform 4 [Hibiscus syriacus]